MEPGRDHAYFLLIGRKKQAHPVALIAAARLLDSFRPLIQERLVREHRGAAIRSPLIRQLTAYLEKHVSEDLRLEQLARHFGASPSYLSRRFSKEMGMPLFAYLNKIRLEQAKRQLKEARDRNITQVCYDVGFRSISQFNRAFRSHTGMSPSAYRRSA